MSVSSKLHLRPYHRRYSDGCAVGAIMQPNILFDDRYEFTLGGVKFEIFHTP